MSVVRLAGFEAGRGCCVRAALVALMFVAGACGPAVSGVSRDVAARSSRAPTRLALAAHHDNPQPPAGSATSLPTSAPELAGASKARTSVVANPQPALPFRVQLVAAELPVPSLSRFGVGFAPVCIAGAGKGPSAEAPSVHVEGTFAERGYDLRLRFDAHTSRSLVLAKRGHTEVALSSLANEWDVLTPGVHELVLFARDVRGVVPTGPSGALAYDVCRFSVSEAGRVQALPEQGSTWVLLGPEGTRHGSVAEAAWVQVAGPAPDGAPPPLEVRRPDGGRELHDVGRGLFEVSPLQNGDYWFGLAASGNGGRERALRLSVNRERPE